MKRNGKELDLYRKKKCQVNAGDGCWGLRLAKPVVVNRIRGNR